MGVKNFKELSSKLRADPKRAAAMDRERKAVLREHIEYELNELRKLHDITQVEMARAMGSHQPTISSIEKGGDVRLSTLQQYVAALGGTLHVSIEVDGEEFPVLLGRESKDTSQRKKSARRKAS